MFNKFTIMYFQQLNDLLRLWYHENKRVFADRLVNNEDNDWFDGLLKSKMKDVYSLEFSDVVTLEPVLYGDFMIPNIDNKIYAEIEDHDKV